MMLLLKGGRVIDPANNVDAILDIFIANGKIGSIAKTIEPETVRERSKEAGRIEGKELRIIVVEGKIIAPGFIDMHAHLREPGYEAKETIATGCKAAAGGGFTAVACMPNTDPVNDNEIVTQYIMRKAGREGCVRVYPIGAITRGSKGESLADFGKLQSAGVVALSDDGEPVMNAEIMRRALLCAKNLALPLIAHCEDKNLSRNGVMHEGSVARRLSLPGIPAAAEDVMVARDIMLANMTSAHLHIAHVSTASAVALIREAKAKGVFVTAEATPHHFSLTDEIIPSVGTNAKVNPPLRPEEHREALCEALADGTIDVIATDHAPHGRAEKDRAFASAPNGLVGLETAVSVTLHELVHTNILTLSQAIAKLSTNPARILNLNAGALREGGAADLTILDLEREFVVRPEFFYSRSHNTPFAGKTFRGGAVMTIVGGNVIWEAESHGG